MFLLTCLLRGMTICFLLFFCHAFVSTHMPLARHDQRPGKSTSVFFVSTHMPLARHDQTTKGNKRIFYGFYSHASCEAWLRYGKLWSMNSLFLLTCLLRGMTYPRELEIWIERFYSHASCEAWRTGQWQTKINTKVSTHMPLARHDKKCYIIAL